MASADEPCTDIDCICPFWAPGPIATQNPYPCYSHTSEVFLDTCGGCCDDGDCTAIGCVYDVVITAYAKTGSTCSFQIDLNGALAASGSSTDKLRFRTGDSESEIECDSSDKIEVFVVDGTTPILQWVSQYFCLDCNE